jgi:hypothetical protein
MTYSAIIIAKIKSSPSASFILISILRSSGKKESHINICTIITPSGKGSWGQIGTLPC